VPLPAIVKQTGTGSTIWTPDWMEDPFNVGIGVVFSGAAGTGSVDISFDNPNALAAASTGYAGTSSMTWFTVVALGSANATFALTTPCQAIRVNLVTAVATSVQTVTFVQATRSPG
jgi:hypothetical protein